MHSPVNLVTDNQKDSANGLAEKALFALTRARSALVLDHPFFAVLALRLNLKEDSSCRDVWTDGRHLGFNPVYAATLPEKKLVGALAHEVMHLALGHHVRRKDRDEGLWNRACDYAVNLLLLDCGFSLPDGFVLDPAYAGMTADDIYARLDRLQDSGAGMNGEAGKHPAPLAGASRNNTPEESGNSTEEKRGETGRASFGDKGDALKRGGRTTGRNAKAGKKQDTAKTFTGEVRDHPGMGENAASRKFAEQEAEIALSQAVQRALHMGSLPAGLTRLVKKKPAVTMDWRELLRRFLEDCADCDYAWTTPNRRYIHQNIYLPSRREPRIPHLALAVDTSGSIDEDGLSIFCAELSSLLEDWDTTLTVLFHDTKVQSSLTLARQDLPLSLSPVGGGGTDFRPVCEHIEEEQLHPACLIWFTDMQCNRFPEEPPYPVLWVSTLPVHTFPPFGEVATLTTG